MDTFNFLLFDSLGEEFELLVALIVIALLSGLFLSLKKPANDSRISTQIQYESRSGSLNLIVVFILLILGIAFLLMLQELFPQFALDTLVSVLAGNF